MPVQAVNDVGNLVSVGLLLATLTLAVTVVFRRLRGKPAGPPAVAAIVCLATYGILLLAVSLASRTREIAPGTDKCFDDWCATVTGVRSLPNKPGAPEKFIAVSFCVSNRAQRAAFRPSQPRVAFVVPDGRVFMPSAAAQGEFERQAGPLQDLTKRVVAGEQFRTSLVFRGTTRRSDRPGCFAGGACRGYAVPDRRRKLVLSQKDRLPDQRRLNRDSGCV